MATKNISRSAIEGGRANKYERNASHRHERSRSRAWLDQLRLGTESAEGSDPLPREHVSKAFTDKLGPCMGWLASHVGQPWDDVRSKLSRAFDTRKLSAWHVVNQHMLPEVRGAGTPNDTLHVYRSQRFYIDEDGLLQDHGKRVRYSAETPHTGPSETQVLAHANGRKVMDHKIFGNKWWALPAPGEWRTCPRYSRCALPQKLHRRIETTHTSLIARYAEPGLRSLGQGDWWRTYTMEHWIEQSWRPHKKFSKPEIAWWDTISWDIRRLLWIKP